MAFRNREFVMNDFEIGLIVVCAMLYLLGMISLWDNITQEKYYIEKIPEHPENGTAPLCFGFVLVCCLFWPIALILKKACGAKSL